MTIGLLEKKLEGGGENHPPPALIPLAKQPARRRVKTPFDDFLMTIGGNLTLALVKPCKHICTFNCARQHHDHLNNDI